jgi:large subunit ribosomal protein L9
MKVLLIEDVKDLGKAGDIRDVSDGYARNYLIPRKLASAATEQNIKQTQQQREMVLRREAKKEKELQAAAKRIDEAEVHFKANVGEQDRLYGSITSGDIARELSRVLGQEIDKHRIDLEDPIRELGTFRVPVRLGKGAIGSVTVVVEKD